MRNYINVVSVRETSSTFLPFKNFQSDNLRLNNFLTSVLMKLHSPVVVTLLQRTALHIFQPLYKIICVMDSLYRNQVFLWEMTSILVHFTMICKNLIKCHVQTTLQLSNELFAGKFYRMIWSIWNIFPFMIIPGFTSKKGKSKSKFYIERVNLEGRVLPFR